MDFNWFFKYFKKPPEVHNFDKNSQESGNDKFENSANIPFSDGFSTIDDPFDAYQHLLFHMDDMFKKMLSIYSIDHGILSNDDLKKNTPREELLRGPNEVLPFSSSRTEGLPVSPAFGHENFSNNGLKKVNPREELLRDPNEVLPFSGFQTEGSTVLQDNGNDQVVRFGPQMFRISEARPEPHFFKSFSSIRRVHLPDGIVEEHHVTSDSSGNSTTTIRRSIGDKTHEIITHSDNKGVKETVENFKNLDENEVLDFNQKLPSFIINQVPAVDKKQNLPSNVILPPPGDSSYLSLFKKFFGQ